MPDGDDAPLRPSDVKPLVEADLDHIYDGDEFGYGGHGAGRNIEGNREFPANWDRERVREAVEAAVWAPDVPKQLSPTERGVELRALYDNVVLLVPIARFDDGWEISTAYPLSGDGVTRNVGGRSVFHFL